MYFNVKCKTLKLVVEDMNVSRHSLYGTKSTGMTNVLQPMTGGN